MKSYFVTIGETEFKVTLSGETAEVQGGGQTVTVRLRSSAPSGGNERVEAPLIAGDLTTGARPILVAARNTESMEDEGFLLELPTRGGACPVRVETERGRLARRVAAPDSRAKPSLTRSPLPGVVQRIVAKEGELIQAGDPILTLEAMKMENDIRAESNGRVTEIFVAEGEAVASGAPLVRIE